MKRLLYLTIPALVLTGWAAARSVASVKVRNAESVVATFPVQPSQTVVLPAAGNYWAFGAGSREDLKEISEWVIGATHDASGAVATISTPDARRAEGRENRSVLDLLFIVRAPAGGAYTLRIARADGDPPAPITLRLTRFDPSAAGGAMRAFGLASLFSVLLVVNAVVWFRRPAA